MAIGKFRILNLPYDQIIQIPSYLIWWSGNQFQISIINPFLTRCKQNLRCEKKMEVQTPLVNPSDGGERDGRHTVGWLIVVVNLIIIISGRDGTTTTQGGGGSNITSPHSAKAKKMEWMIVGFFFFSKEKDDDGF